jgi:hypothetical protein
MVPMQFVGLARDVRRHIDRDALAWGDKADALLAPLKTGAKVSKVALVRAFHAWRKLPAAGRLGELRIELDTAACGSAKPDFIPVRSPSVGSRGKTTRTWSIFAG